MTPIYALCWTTNSDDQAVSKSQNKIEQLIEKRENIQSWRVWKSQSQNKKMKKYSSLIRQRYLPLKE